MLRSIFVVAASLCAPAVANVVGFRWGFDQVPATGLADLSFPLTLVSASGAGTYSFYQGFNFGGNASDSSIGLNLKAAGGNATNGTSSSGCASLTAFFTTKADGALTKSDNCRPSPNGGLGLLCEVQIAPCAKINKSAYTLVLESLASDGTITRRWEHGPGGSPGGGLIGGGPGSGPVGGGPGGPGGPAPGHGGGPSGPWGGGNGWDNSTKCNTTSRAPIVRRWWFGGAPAGNPWGSGNGTQPPSPTGTHAPKPSGHWGPTGTAPAPSGGWAPTGTQAPMPPFRGAGLSMLRRAATGNNIESRDTLNATVWRGSIVDQASQITTVIGIWQLPDGSVLKPAYTGGIYYPSTAGGKPLVTVEFGNPTSSTPGVSGGAITNPFNMGGWSPVSNHTVTGSGISLAV